MFLKGIKLLIFLSSSLSFAQYTPEEIKVEIEKGHYARVEEQLESYLLSNPTDTELRELYGDALAHQKKWDQAIEVYSVLIDEMPEKADLHYKLGGSLGLKAKEVSKLRALTYVTDIRRSFLKAVELDPKHIDAHWALVEYYMALPGILGGSYKTALSYADDLEDISKVDAALAKGYIYEYSDEPELAEKFYLKAVRVGGSYVCYDKLSAFYESNNQPHQSIKVIEEAQKKRPRNALHYQLGKVSADYNVQLDKGLACLRIYVENYSVKDGVPLEWAYLRMAQIYRRQNKKDQALIAIDKALSIQSEFELAHTERQHILAL